MRLRKQIGAVVLAASMAVTMLPVSAPFTVMEAEAAEPEDAGDVSLPGAELENAGDDKDLSGAELEEEIKDAADAADNGKEEEAFIAALAAAEETGITITNVTTADTYYSVNGNYPLYVECVYISKEPLTYSQVSRIKLKVAKEDGTAVAEAQMNAYVEGSENYGYFSIQKCSNVKNGDKLPLKLSLVYTDDSGAEKELWTDTRTIAFTDKANWVKSAYWTTGTVNYYADLYSTESEMISTTGVKTIDGIYLIDKDGKVAAGSTVDSIHGYVRSSSDPRYQEIFKRDFYPDNWKYCYMNGDLYRTRKLVDKEVLHAAYSVNGEMHELKDVTVTVTEQPYIMGIASNNRYYPGEENTSGIQVSGVHVDFSKLSIELKDPSTGDTAGESVSSMIRLEDRNFAYYVIKWREGYQLDKWYNVEYHYSDNKTELISEKKRVYVSDYYSNNIIWNPKADMIEYYNKEIPANTVTAYEIYNENKSNASAVLVTSGSISTDSTHLIKVLCKNTFETGQTYYLYVTYTNAEGKETTKEDSVYIYQNKWAENPGPGDPNAYSIYSYSLGNLFYLSNNKKPEFLAWLYCSDKSKLAASCDASLYNKSTNTTVGTVKMTLKDNDGSLSYQGSYDAALPAGRYRLSFKPDGNNTLIYDFYVDDSERMSVCRHSYQSNQIAYGYIRLQFPSKDIADWYLSEENQKKLKVKILDIQKKEIGTYELAKGDFSISKSTSDYRNIIFKDSIKKEFENLYYCYVYVYYDNKEIAVSFWDNYDSTTKSLYELGYAEYIRWETSSGWIHMDCRVVDYFNGKQTYNGVYGSENAFPATVKITDWYSLKTVKEIAVPNSGYKFTEKDLEGLSPTKVYKFFVNGADGSASSDTGYVDVIYGDEFFTRFSKVYPLSGDFDVTFEFTNKSKGINNHENYLVCFANVFEQIYPKLNDNPGYKEYYVLRADAWGWSIGPTGTVFNNKTLEGNEVTYQYDWEWDQFLTMIKDSKITMNIKRVGNNFTVDAKIKGADAKDYTYKAAFTTNADKDMTIFFTNENADVSILSFTDNTNNTTTPPTSTVTTPSTSTVTTTPNTTEPAKNEEPNPEESKDPEDNKTEEPENPSENKPDDTKTPEEPNEPEKSNDKTTTAKGKLTLKKSKMTLKKGQKSTIKITSKLNTKVTYKSLNKSIATVSKKGVVTAKKAGRTKISVKANGKTKKVTVTVKGTAEKNTTNVPVVKLGKNSKLSETKAVLKKGSKMKIQAASSISENVTYSSLNKKIASVSVNGVIKAKKKGKTAIVIKTGEKTIKLNITVKR